MQLGVIDLGRAGAHIARRLLARGHQCVVFDTSCRLVAELGAECAYGAASVRDLVNELDAPRTIWLAGPAATVDPTIAELLPHLEAGDIIVVCGNSSYVDDIRRAAELAAAGIHYVDVGVNGRPDGGPERTWCLTIGGDEGVVRYLDPIFAQLAGCSAPLDAGGVAESAIGGYLHCGPTGSGHFVSMVHDDVERRQVAACVQGFSILRAATKDRATGLCQFDFDLPSIAELWRRGSSVASTVLDRTAEALVGQADRTRDDKDFSSRLLRALQQACETETPHR